MSNEQDQDKAQAPTTLKANTSPTIGKAFSSFLNTVIRAFQSTEKLADAAFHLASATDKVCQAGDVKAAQFLESVEANKATVAAQNYANSKQRIEDLNLSKKQTSMLIDNLIDPNE